MGLSPQFTAWTVLGLVLTLALWFVKWKTNKAEMIKKAEDDIDKEIDAANNADSIMRVSGKLRDKI